MPDPRAMTFWRAVEELGFSLAEMWPPDGSLNHVRITISFEEGAMRVQGMLADFETLNMARPVFELHAWDDPFWTGTLPR